MDCLKFLVRLCSDLGLKEAQEYSLKLRKAEKILEAKRQRELSGSSRGSSGSKGRGASGLRPPAGSGKDRVLSGGSGMLVTIMSCWVWSVMCSDAGLYVIPTGNSGVRSGDNSASRRREVGMLQF